MGRRVQMPVRHSHTLVGAGVGTVRAATPVCWSLKKEAEEKTFPASGLELAQPKSLSPSQS